MMPKCNGDRKLENSVGAVFIVDISAASAKNEK
jgi:hypothetical protein